MPEVRITRIQLERERLLLLTQQVVVLYDAIRRRVFQGFESRWIVHGYDREDWLEAERSLIFAPPASLSKKIISSEYGWL